MEKPGVYITTTDGKRYRCDADMFNVSEANGEILVLKNGGEPVAFVKDWAFAEVVHKKPILTRVDKKDTP